MARKFKPGDVVRMKGGSSPDMTVEAANEDEVSCVWFAFTDVSGPHRAAFRPVLLEKVKPPLVDYGGALEKSDAKDAG